MDRFRDRTDAGGRLAEALREEARHDPIVLGLARGGVPVAYEVARRLEAPLDVLVVRKLGVPGSEELAMGAIAPGATRVLNEDVIRALNVPPQVVGAVAAREQRVLESRERLYRDGRPAMDLRGRAVILVDDGIATGASMRAAIVSVRAAGAARVTAAVPTGSRPSCRALGRDAERVVCLASPARLVAVGQAYADFSPTTDAEVRKLLALRRSGAPP